MTYIIKRSWLSRVADSLRDYAGDGNSRTVAQITEEIGPVIAQNREVLRQIIEGSVGPSFTVPDGVATIGPIFSHCANLTQILIPEGVTTIEREAFDNCYNLTQISLPESIRNIGLSAFRNCKNLALTELPEGITRIGGDAFTGCTNLALTTIPAGITRIEAYTFSRCTNLRHFVIPEGVSSIGGMAFESCSNLSSITFKGTPSGEVFHNIFSLCSNLTTINVPWAEGEVAGAPWGATNATINYNYTGE